MPDELSINPEEEVELSAVDDATDDGVATSDANDEFEEISSDEVDRVVEALEGILATVDSENIQSHLEEAVNHIFALVYDEEDLEAVEDEVQDEVQDEAA